MATLGVVAGRAFALWFLLELHVVQERQILGSSGPPQGCFSGGAPPVFYSPHWDGKKSLGNVGVTRWSPGQLLLVAAGGRGELAPLPTLFPTKTSSAPGVRANLNHCLEAKQRASLGGDDPPAWSPGNPGG